MPSPRRWPLSRPPLPAELHRLRSDVQPLTPGHCRVGHRVGADCDTARMGTWDVDQLQAEIAAVYAAHLPIPPWWPAEERTAFIDQHAGAAASSLLTQLDDVGDRAADSVYDIADGRRMWADEIAAAVTVEQEALLDEARSSVMWDLTDAIAEHSAFLTSEATFRPGRGQSRDVRYHAVSLCAVSARLRPPGS